jgi:hypothetical protein
VYTPLTSGIPQLPEHNQQVEEDAGGADNLQALDIPQQGERKCNKYAQPCK